MRIHRVTLQNYRGVTHAQVDFPDDGVTIIEGDNEVGKTSVSEAIDMVLADRDDSKRRGVLAVKPVDRDVGAEVDIELSTGAYRIRYRKRWHRQKETVLEILEPDKSQLTGRDAHDRVQEILAETMDSGLWEALRLRQGLQLEQAAFAGGSLGRALDMASGGEATGDREDDLWERIVAERDRYWTATGQPKSERTALAQHVADAEAQVAALKQLLTELEHDAQSVDRLAADAVVLADSQREHTVRLDDLVERFEAVRRRRGEVSRLSGVRDTARAVRDRAVEVGKARTGLVERADEAVRQLAEATAEVESAAPVRAAIEERRRAAQVAVTSARTAVGETEADQRRAVEDRDFRRQQIEWEQLSERLERISAANARRAHAAEVVETVRVDAELFARIEAANIDVIRAEASADSGSASVTAVALADTTFHIDGDAVALESGSSHQASVAESMEIEIPGRLRVTVTAGSEARVLATRLAEARAALRSACEAGHVADLAAARVASHTRVEAERVLEETATSIQQDLRDLTADDLAQKVDRLAARIATYEAERPSEPPLPTDLDAAQAQVADADARLADLRATVERLDRDAEAAAAAVQSAEIGDATAKARLEQAMTQREQIDSVLAAARAELADDAVAVQIAEAEAEASAREADLVAAETDLAAEDPESVEALLDNARAVAARLAEDLHDNEIRSRELRAALGVRGEEGLANKLDVAMSERVRLGNDHERLEARAAASKRLHDTFSARRAEAHHRYVAPFREKVEQLGRLVFGPDFEVELDDELCISRRTLEGITLDFDHLSTGAQEQLGIISRLACASLVAADGGVPVIFDDALGWSDPGRLERMGAVLSSAGKTCQIIVLTCTPGRYQGVGDATVVQLAG